jgi:hypothetical protein
VSLVGGVLANFGALTSAAGRLEIGSRLRLSRGWIEIAAHTGLGFGEVSDETDRGASTLRLWQIPLSAGFGYGFQAHRHIALALSVRGGAVVVLVNEQTIFQPTARRTYFAPLIECSAGIMVRAWRGEVVFQMGFAFASGPEGSGLAGNLQGLVVMLGYRVFVV